jgi:hypothetical protein
MTDSNNSFSDFLSALQAKNPDLHTKITDNPAFDADKHDSVDAIGNDSDLGMTDDDRAALQQLFEVLNSDDSADGDDDDGEVEDADGELEDIA